MGIVAVSVAIGDSVSVGVSVDDTVDDTVDVAVDDVVVLTVACEKIDFSWFCVQSRFSQFHQQTLVEAPMVAVKKTPIPGSSGQR